MKAKLPGQGASYEIYAEKKRAAVNKYRRENPEKFRKSVRLSQERNKEQTKATKKAWYELNKELVKEKRRARYKLEKAAKEPKIRTCWKYSGKRLPPDKYKISGFVMIETSDTVLLPRGL